MVHVEQVVFTSAETDRSAGYQVVAKSPGVCHGDARELAIWGPSHDSLLELGPDAVSFNFHPLPSGAYCVSRTTAAGWEYSGRGGHRVYTQCLIVPSEVLARFANNPFAVIQAAEAVGMWVIHDQAPKRLERLYLAGGAAPVDQTLLARLAAEPGPQKLAVFIQAALDSTCLAVGGPPSAGQLIAGLFHCLPTECRTEFSFSTGLKFSSRRPFRIVALSGDRSEQRWVAHRHRVTVLELSDRLALESVPMDGWAQLIKRVVFSGRTSFLATQLSKRRFQLTLDDLPALGLQLLEDLDASALRKDHARDKANGPFFHPAPRLSEQPHGDEEPGDDEKETPTVVTSEALPVAEAIYPSGQAADGSEGLRHAHAAHRKFAKTPADGFASHNDDAGSAEKRKAPVSMTIGPSKTLDPDSPAVLAKLEHLDDVVYEAIAGAATALEQLEKLWPKVLDELGEELVAESREQYLRYALLIWQECLQRGGVRNPSRAVQALDVLCVLFNET